MAEEKYSQNHDGKSQTKLRGRSPKPIQTCLLLLALGLFLFAPPALTRDLWVSQEARRALIGLEIARDGHWAVPHRLGVPILTKPPFFYWLVALAYSLTDSLATWVPRLPSLIFALAGVCAFWRILFLLLGEEEALVGGAILILSPSYHWMAQFCDLEMVFVSTGLIALMGFWESMKNTTFAAFWKRAMYFFLGVSFLTKGPLVPLMVLITVGTWAAIAKPPDFLKRLGLGWGWILFLAPTIFWGILLLLEGNSFQIFLPELRHHTSSEASPHFKPPHYYLENLHKFLFPWFLMIPVAIAQSVITVWSGPTSTTPCEDNLTASSKTPTTPFKETLHTWWDFWREDTGARLFILVWFGASLVVLSVVPSKRYYYALNLIPSTVAVCALIYGRWRRQKTSWLESFRAHSTKMIASALGLGVAFLIASALIERPEVWQPFNGDRTLDAKIILGLLGVWLLGIAFVIRWVFRNSNTHFWTRALFTWSILWGIGVVVFYSHVLYPDFKKNASFKRAAREIQERLPANAEVYSVGFCYEIWYYWGKTKVTFLLSPNDVRKFIQEHPDAYGIVYRKKLPILKVVGDYKVLYEDAYMAEKKRRPLLVRVSPP